MDEGVAIVADLEGVGNTFAKGVHDYILSKGDRSFSMRLINVKKTTFKDGEYKIKVEENIRRKSCFYIHDSNKVPSVWVSDLLFTLECLRSSSASEINVVFPYVRFARQDRKDESRVSVSIKALVDMIGLYADRAMSVDLHTPQIQEFGSFPFDNLLSFPSVIDYLIKKHGDFLENLVLVSPDLGGGKRVEAFQKALRKKKIEAGIALGYKTRKKDNHVEEVEINGDVRGCNCLILDDIIDTGGTAVSSYLTLKNMGAEKIRIYGSHGLFNEGVKKFKGLEGIMTSDTVYGKNTEGVEVISLVNLFGEAIYRTFVGESLSSLFE